MCPAFTANPGIFMRYSLSNSQLHLEVESLGAELKSARSADGGREYLWQADPAYWNRTSPVLFPIVGSLTGKTCFVDGQPWSMPQHGLARDREFTLVDHGPAFLVFELQADNATRAAYPFDFVLRIRYDLEGDTVRTGWTVVNPADAVMPFSIGAHPGFSTALADGDVFEDYEVVLDHKAQYHLWALNDRGQLVDTPVPFREPLDRFGLEYRYFEVDALVFPDRQLSEVTVRSRKHGHGVTVGFEGFPIVALWTADGKRKRSPFLCVEPWFGHADTQDGPFELARKPGIRLLPAGEMFKAVYTMRFF